MTERIHFHTTDRYRIEGAAFHYIDADASQGFFRREDGSDAIERFDWPRLHKLAEQGLLVQESRSKDIAIAKSVPADQLPGVWEMPDTDLLGQRFLTRSIRKDDLAICPVCWLEQGRDCRMDAAELPIRADWLPRMLSTCATHRVALIPLPYTDYTTCYDAPARCRLQPKWLQRIEDLIVEKRPSRFERAVLAQLEERKACPWLPDVQLDVLERWCLGLGAMMQLGEQTPVDLNPQEQQQLIDDGYDVTSAGFEVIKTEVDRSLGKFGLRLR